MLCDCSISKLCFLIVAFPGYLLVYFSYAGFVLSLFVPYLSFWYLRGWGRGWAGLGVGGGGEAVLRECGISSLCFVIVAFPGYILYFVFICSICLSLLVHHVSFSWVPREGCASQMWRPLRIFAYIFNTKIICP